MKKHLVGCEGNILTDKNNSPNYYAILQILLTCNQVYPINKWIDDWVIFSDLPLYDTLHKIM